MIVCSTCGGKKIISEYGIAKVCPSCGGKGTLPDDGRDFLD